MRAAGVDMSTVYLHGNNKSADELRLAVEAETGHVVIDNLDEVALLDGVAGELGARQPVLLRVSPGVDAHTHEKTTTGILDSKFGVPTATGAAEEALRAIAAARRLELRGLHMHLGSPIFEVAPYERAIEVVAAFWADVVRDRLGLEVPVLSVGGGFAAGYAGEQEPPEPADYARAIASTLRREAEARGLLLPQLVIEPGRALVARAGVALYTVGRAQGDPRRPQLRLRRRRHGRNIRPAMYGSKYELLSAERPARRGRGPSRSPAATASRATSSRGTSRSRGCARARSSRCPAAGAYQLAMSSNYNLATRPAVVLLADGEARLLRRRESHDDLMALDVDA